MISEKKKERVLYRISYKHSKKWRIPNELLNDKEFIVKALREVDSNRTDKLVKLIDQSNTELLLALCEVKESWRINSCSSKIMSYLSDELKNSKDFMMKAVDIREDNFYHASKELRADKEFVLHAVEKKGNFLGDASDELKNDKDVVLMAVKHREGVDYIDNRSPFKYASKELRDDKSLYFKF